MLFDKMLLWVYTHNRQLVELSLYKFNLFIMPKLDGTGPAGEGKMTGRGMGKCEDASENQGGGAGIGACGRRRGMGRRRYFNNTNTQTNDQK